MNRAASPLGISLFLAAAQALAQSASTDFFFVTFPNGWQVEKDKNGSFLATPAGSKHDQSVSIDSCSRLARSDCQTSCEEAELRKNFFYFFVDQSSTTHSRQSRSDGFESFHASGLLGESQTWVTASVLCGANGVVYIVSTSMFSRTDAAVLLELVLGSIQWQEK